MYTIKSITKNNITSRDTWAYDMARKIAALSECRYKLGSVIIGGGGKVLSVGHNVLKSHSAHAHWPPHVVSLHAEHNCILRANCDVSGATIYVARVGGNEISKPCVHCYNVLCIAGIRAVVYCNGVDLIKIRI